MKIMEDIIKSYDILINQINNNIRWLKAHPKILDKEEHKYLYPVFENAMYIAIAASDLIVSLKYLDVTNISKNGIETNYFSRNVALISYELINHYKKMVGPDASRVIREKRGDDALKDFEGVHKKIKAEINKHYKSLNYIRNNLIGHRILNGTDMANAMLKIDPIEIYKIGKHIFDIFIETLAVYIKHLSKL